MPIERVKQAIEDIKHGKMVVMVDDEDRENEGDLVYAATFSTPEKVNFMASVAKGLICTPLTEEIAQRLELIPMRQLLRFQLMHVCVRQEFQRMREM